MKMVREYLDVSENSSLDDVIDVLTALRASLPAGAHAEVRMRGDDVFGRRLSICYDRLQSAAEAQIEARYADRESGFATSVSEIAAYERIAGEISLAA